MRIVEFKPANTNKAGWTRSSLSGSSEYVSPNAQIPPLARTVAEKMVSQTNHKGMKESREGKDAIQSSSDSGRLAQTLLQNPAMQLLIVYIDCLHSP
jgi:hypothetical protein